MQYIPCSFSPDIDCKLWAEACEWPIDDKAIDHLLPSRLWDCRSLSQALVVTGNVVYGLEGRVFGKLLYVSRK